jgi:hypothetical protein
LRSRNRMYREAELYRSTTLSIENFQPNMWDCVLGIVDAMITFSDVRLLMLRANGCFLSAKKRSRHHSSKERYMTKLYARFH